VGNRPDDPHEPGDSHRGLIRFLVLHAKVLLMIFFFMWTRWSWPRFKYDQLMSIGWKVMIPLGLVNLLMSAIVQEFLPRDSFALKAAISWGTLVLVFCWYAMKSMRELSPTTFHQSLEHSTVSER